jgi:hypothetical protein
MLIEMRREPSTWVSASLYGVPLSSVAVVKLCVSHRALNSTARRFANGPRYIAAKYATRLRCVDMRYAAKPQASRPGWRQQILWIQDRLYAPKHGPRIMTSAATHRRELALLLIFSKRFQLSRDLASRFTSNHGRSKGELLLVGRSLIGQFFALEVGVFHDFL